MANKKAIAKSIIKWSFYSVCALGLFFVIYAATIIANSPKIDPDNIYSYLNETSIIYDDSGNKVDSVYLDGGNRINMKYEDFPKNLINAVVAVEDKTFWSHHGFNILRMFGAIKESLFSENSIGGTSTITQQLARNVYLPDRKSERSLDRKISEAW
ncbi:MAG: transglycosylase domain-containing protein, partial [Anaerovoracaceae bacterium]|nr:transglycosylase domain-containing protein [Anaerovoracaceae bacterium]